MELLHFYISPGHNFFGHHGQAVGQNPTIEVPEIECVHGHGIRNDRFFDHKQNYKGQVTFLAYETYSDLCARLGVTDRNPGVFRRNVITRNADLNTLIGVEFEVQGVRFVGTEECTPCHWMNQAFHPGAEQLMKGRGGLRARILSSGMLRATVMAVAARA